MKLYSVLHRKPEVLMRGLWMSSTLRIYVLDFFWPTVRLLQLEHTSIGLRVLYYLSLSSLVLAAASAYLNYLYYVKIYYHLSMNFIIALHNFLESFIVSDNSQITIA
jgi:hypothetical protein